MMERDDYLAKAKQSLRGAESELAQARFDNTANRAYYACFQAAVAALITAGMPVQTEAGGLISHQAVHSGFSGLLIHRRKLYPSHLRSVLQDLLRDRILADYRPAPISSTRVARVLRQCQVFVSEIESRLREMPGESR
ncbi:MAG: HEPN domain-containing protein [Chloroflexi bacterium]|nr:HEPN domain-containing protein [Chloroflexota bacterium]